jgi:hypothetical protein
MIEPASEFGLERHLDLGERDSESIYILDLGHGVCVAWYGPLIDATGQGAALTIARL